MFLQHLCCCPAASARVVPSSPHAAALFYPKTWVDIQPCSAMYDLTASNMLSCRNATVHLSLTA
jgi:hypothetical protein